MDGGEFDNWPEEVPGEPPGGDGGWRWYNRGGSVYVYTGGRLKYGVDEYWSGNMVILSSQGI